MADLARYSLSEDRTGHFAVQGHQQKRDLASPKKYMTMNLLAIYWHTDPVLLRIGDYELRWYSVLYASVFLIGWINCTGAFSWASSECCALEPGSFWNT